MPETTRVSLHHTDQWVATCPKCDRRYSQTDIKCPNCERFTLQFFREINAQQNFTASGHAQTRRWTDCGWQCKNPKCKIKYKNFICYDDNTVMAVPSVLAYLPSPRLGELSGCLAMVIMGVAVWWLCSIPREVTIGNSLLAALGAFGAIFVLALFMKTDRWFRYDK